MAWEPKINVADARQFRDNLIVHIKANQGDALVWANAGRILPEIKEFYKGPRTRTIFPCTTFLQVDHKSKWEDILEIDFSITLETALIHGKQDVLSDLGPKYSMALESLLTNVPETTFNTGSIIDVTSTGMSVETLFAVQGKFKTQFIEIFQTRATWRIEASAFTE